MHLWIRLLLLLVAQLDLWSRVDGIVDGDHFFRQSHVLANVDQMQEQGILRAPSTWNEDMFLRLYDVPVWQVVVTGLSSGLGLPSGLVAEGFAALLFALLFVLAWRIGELLRLPPLATTVALCVLALAPIGRFWFAAASPDPLVVCLATASLCAWLQLQEPAGRARGWLALWLLGAFLATLVKAPVYLPTAITVLVHAVQQRGWRGLFAPRLLVFAATMLSALVATRLLTAVANAAVPGWPDAATELGWYFGSWQERSSWRPYGSVLGRIVREVMSVPGTAVALLALAFLRSWRLSVEARGIVVVHALAAVGGSLLFLHVNVVHNYYPLPCLVPLALLVGQGASWACDACSSWWLQRSGRAQRWPAALVLAAVLGGALWSSLRYLERIASFDTSAMRAAGAFVRGASMPDDFVLYGTIPDDDNPVYLYFVQRHGANVQAATPTATLRDRWLTAAIARQGRLLLFVPIAAAEQLAQRRAEPAWREVAAGAAGAVFAFVP
jgi:hypothetical protein